MFGFEELTYLFVAVDLIIKVFGSFNVVINT